MIPKNEWIKRAGECESGDILKQQSCAVGNYLIDWSTYEDEENVWVFHKTHRCDKRKCKPDWEWCFCEPVTVLFESSAKCDGQELFDATCLFYSHMSDDNFGVFK